MTRVKICGIRTLEEARAAAKQGADMLGFHFSRRSSYVVDRDDATAICDALRNEFADSCPLLVGVFVDELVSNVSAITLKVGLDAAQLSGHESDAILKELRGIGFKKVNPINKAMALEDVKYFSRYFPSSNQLPSLMLDVFFDGFEGGPQDSRAVALAVKAQAPRLMLTGGFTLNNVVERLQTIRPWAVDVNEGVDKAGKPGVKDQAKIKAIIDAVRSA